MTLSFLDDSFPETIRVLHVDDDPAFADLTASFLERVDSRFRIDSAESGPAALDRLATGQYDCVVADYDMPDLNGIEFLERVRERHPDLPFVLFTGKGSEEIASDAISAGVDDYLQKETTPDQFALLGNRLENVVDQYRSLRALEASQERLSLFVEQSPLGIIEWDTDMTVLGCNEAAEEILGYAATDLAGESYRVIVAEESVADVDALVEELSAARGGFYSVDRNVRADGTEITCEWHNRVITDDDGDPVAIFSQFRDVTDREERERQLDELRTQYQLLIDHLPEAGVFLFDEEMRYTLAGGQELEAVGLSSADFEGSTPHELFEAEVADEIVYHGRRALAGEHVTYETEYQGNHYRVVVVPVRDADGEVVSGMAVSLNVTEQHLQAVALERQLERMEEFAGVVSHDLRNPLGVADGHLELAMDECESDHLAAVARAHDRMRALVDDLLTLARTGAPVQSTEPVSLAELAETSWFTVDTGEATLRVETDRTVEADPGRLQQLFENLFRNAVEHGSTSPASQARQDAVEHGSTGRETESHDAVEHDTEHVVVVTVGDLDTGADGDGDSGMERGFYVADDGPGIPPKAREDVFEAGYSTSAAGTGFGLRIVRQIAETHGWTVRVTESDSGGARFDITGVEEASSGD